MLDYRGNVIARDAHEPYGATWVQWREGDARGPEYQMTGKERAPVSRSVSIGVREYVPELGRWTSPDPLYLSQPDNCLNWPGERNEYRYAANNPIQYTDPSGTSVWTKLAKIGGKVASGVSVTEAVRSAVQDAQTLADPSASTFDRVVAGVSLASEVLPVSARDVLDITTWGARKLGLAKKAQKALPAAPELRALPQRSSASRGRGRSRNRVPDRIQGRPTDEQQALIKMAKKDSDKFRRGGNPVSHGDADAYVDLAQESGVPVRAKPSDLEGGHWGGQPHIHVNGTHVPVEGGYTPPAGKGVIQ